MGAREREAEERKGWDSFVGRLRTWSEGGQRVPLARGTSCASVRVEALPGNGLTIGSGFQWGRNDDICHSPSCPIRISSLSKHETLDKIRNLFILILPNTGLPAGLEDKDIVWKSY